MDGLAPRLPDEVELEEVEGVAVDGLLTVELDGLLEAEAPLDWLGDTVYTADGFGRLLELDGLLEAEAPPDWLGDTVYTADGFGRLLELDGLFIDEAAGLLLVDDGRTADGELIPLDGLP